MYLRKGKQFSSFAQGVAYGIVLSFERHQDCNVQFKTNGTIQGH